MYHVRYRADHIGCIEHGYGLRSVGHAYCDPVLLLYAKCFERLCRGNYVLNGVCVGGLFAHEVIGNVVRVFLCHVFNGFRHCAVRIIKRFRHAAIELKPRLFNFLHLLTSE